MKKKEGERKEGRQGSRQEKIRCALREKRRLIHIIESEALIF